MVELGHVRPSHSHTQGPPVRHRPVQQHHGIGQVGRVQHLPLPNHLPHRRQRGQRPAARPRSPRKTPHIPASRSTAGVLGRRNPGVQPQRDGGVPQVAGQRPPCGAGSSARGPTPAGYCGIVQMGPQADAPGLGLGHLLSMNALIEICGSRNDTRAPGGRPSMVPASRSGGHLKETRCATASIQRG